MKKKIKVKLKNGLKNERKVIITLAIISVVSLLISLIVEMFSDPSEPTHWDYIKNILLGASGSSIISFVCLILPYNRNRDSQVKNIKIQLTDIYSFYISKLFYFERLSNGEYVSDFLFQDIKIYKDIDKVLKKISNVIYEYKTADFYSDDISNIINMLNSDMQEWLLIIKQFYTVVLPGKTEDESENVSYNMEKEPQYLIQERECFTVLLNSLNQILSEVDIEELFEKIGVSKDDAIYYEIYNISNDLNTASTTYDTTKKSSEVSVYMHIQLIDILLNGDGTNNQLLKKYNGEFKEIINNEKFHFNKYCHIVVEIYRNLGKFNFEKAKSEIELLRKAVEEDNS